MTPDVPDKTSNFIFYSDMDGNVKIEVIVKDETVWLTQRAMADLFGVKVPAISKHLSNIYESGELDKNSTISFLETVQKEGKRDIARSIEYYNLDAIIAVGYRINSYQATKFRIWATKVLREFLIKGFVLDDHRLKQGSSLFGVDYFEELLERIREIRASERRFYQKITDIYSIAVDYDMNAPLTRDFFAKVQNKLHWAINGKTAAEMIYDSADSTKPNMGLRTWKYAPKGKILRSDVSVAKNYLDIDHIKELNRLVSAYLDLAENRALKHVTTTMREWSEFLDGFLELSDYPILEDKGKVTMLDAKIKAETEFDKFRVLQDRGFISDFDDEIRKIINKSKK